MRKQTQNVGYLCLWGKNQRNKTKKEHIGKCKLLEIPVSWAECWVYGYVIPLCSTNDIYTTKLLHVLKHSTGRDTQHFMSLGKCKLKQHWNTTAHLLEGVTFKPLTTSSADEDRE